MQQPTEAERREQVIAEHRKKLLKHKEIDSKVRALRDSVKELKKEYDKTEDDLKSLQSVGQIIGEVLRQLDDERCEELTAWLPRARSTRHAHFPSINLSPVFVLSWHLLNLYKHRHPDMPEVAASLPSLPSS